ncbi:MAG TPA: hypothetical protein VI461_16310, partial [Chitinophagaceae bacterium]|nr:hypothetical protein [Chitinophagaceae bacterium]
PALSKYGNGITEKVLKNEEVITAVKNCWPVIKKYNDLDTIRKIEDLTEMYSQLGQKFPDLRNKSFPDFNKLDYRNTMNYSGHKITLDAGKHADLLKRYYAGRKDRLSSGNAFGSMIIQFPELVENLRKAAKEELKREVIDDVLNLWLEMSYYKEMRLNAVKQIVSEEQDVRSYLDDGCLAYLPNRFAEVAKENKTPQKWVGVFANENLTLKFQESRGFIFATSDVRVGSASESSQWNLTVSGGDADGDWTVTYTDDEKTVKRSGKITVKLDGDIMKFDMLLDKTEITWKPDVKQYEIPNLPKGTKMDGTLTRKN